MSELEDFNFECLHAHNGLRKSHNVKPLQYNKDLSIQAQKYAEIIAKKDIMEHSKNEDRDNAGENLAYCMMEVTDYKYSGLGASVSWYSEIKDYDYSKEEQSPGNPATGHFTQLIWEDSKEAGFGRAMNKESKKWYIVGRYQPPGNFVGSYKEKVLPLPKGKKWDTLPIVEERLEELRTIEYTRARKHILDKWSSEWEMGTKAGVYFCNVTETFTTPTGSTYTGTNSFSEDPRKLPRPAFGMNLDDSIYDIGNDNSHPNDTDSDRGHDDEVQKFVDAILSQHNLHRRNHNVQTLQLDPQLCNYAQDWADGLMMEDKLSFSEYLYDNKPVGENLTTTKSELNEALAKALVESWYNEGKNYNYRNEPGNSFKQVGHFTQLVWKNSKKIGIGIGQHTSGKSYIVCFYHPSGNVKNTFTANVLKP